MRGPHECVGHFREARNQWVDWSIGFLSRPVVGFAAPLQCKPNQWVDWSIWFLVSFPPQDTLQTGHALKR